MSGKEVLSKEDRGKDNPAPDAYHYDYPRLCYHADAAFHATLTDLYDKELPPSGDEVRVLDLCSSWVSHYPSERQWGRVDGLGLNREELLKNPLLDFFQVRDLNQNRTLPYPDSVFDAVTCALSFQYMQYPEEVVAELSRVMKPGGVAVVSFSNRMFPSKAIYAWKQRSDGQRLELIKNYFKTSPSFPSPEGVDKTTPLHALSYLSAMTLGYTLCGDPFLAVVARKS